MKVANLSAGPTLIPTEVLEGHSHRSQHAANFINQAKADLASYLDIPSNYDEELVSAHKKAVDSELKLDYMMGDGVEFPKFPEVQAPKADGSGPIVVADMSSNILSRRSPVKNFTVPSPSFLRKIGLPIPPVVFTYETIAKNNSLSYSAPNSDEVDGQEAVANANAALIYNALEAHPNIYKIVPDKSIRSKMNICFRNGNTDKAKSDFSKKGTALGLTGLKGHRSVGCTEKLAQLLNDFTTNA
ncbi:phosphoserine aminotransferase [Biscogniauxia mediterranea]|nr:phosphoserine aminotransferase [Biscogniauxia mediterranea]